MKKKILFVDIQGWGGIAHYSYNLLQALAGRSDLECLLVTDRSYELSALERRFTLITAGLRGQPYLSAISRLVRIIRGIRPDILHVQSVITVRRDWFWFVLGRLLGYRIVLTAHNVLPHEEYEQKACFMKQALAIIYRCACRIIVHSQYSRDRLIRIFKVDGQKIAVIPHGNYLFLRTREMDMAQARQALGIPVEKKVLIHFGTLRRYKGIPLILEAFARLRRMHGEVVLLLAGKPSGVPDDYFPGLISGLGLERDVLYRPGYVASEDIQTYFYASDLALFSYTEIDTSGSVQLALAFGKPVIACRTGSMAEVIEDRGNGLLVAHHDPQAMVEAMEKVLYDPALRERMGRRSLELARERFCWDAIAAGTQDLYSQVW